MRSVFDTRGAHFDPEQIAILSTAYQQAVRAIKSPKPLSEDMKSKVAKMIVNLGRQKLRAHEPFDATELSTRTAEFMQQLRALSLIH